VVVRLPDELPPSMPGVRLVLDTFLPCELNEDPLTCDAHHELLDALVRVWLGVARGLVERGARVTLVTAAPQRGEGAARGDVAVRAMNMATRAQTAALRLGAEVRWQEDVGVEDLVTDAPDARGGAKPARARTLVVSYRVQPDPEGGPQVEWIVVPRSLWATFDVPVPRSAFAFLPHPMGSADNRSSRRRAERARVKRFRADTDRLLDLCPPSPPRDARSVRALVATPAGADRVRLEAL
jgi:hypothetical protein